MEITFDHHVAMFAAFPLMVLWGGIDPTPVAFFVCFLFVFSFFVQMA